MTVNDMLRMFAGAFVLLTLALSQLHSPYWLLFTAFVGLNLLQSAFTKWCPLMSILRHFKVRDHDHEARKSA